MNETAAVQSTSLGMGTVITHSVYGEQAEDALQAAGKETTRLEGLLSRFWPESEISRINRSAGIRCEKVSDETYEVLSQAFAFSRCCQGRFDVTISPLVTLWNVQKGSSEPPLESEIKKVLPLVDYTCLLLDPYGQSVGLKKAGQSIDLGGIGKGFAADKILEIFKKHGITSAFTNFGGNVAVIGTKPDSSPWRVGIRHPRMENTLIGAVSVINKSVVTSGDYQRYFIADDGKRYHHILDPSTGYPAESGLVSVTVVADNSLAADALSTILFISGMEKGLKILRTFPGAEAVFVDQNLSVSITQGLKDCYQAVGDIQMV